METNSYDLKKTKGGSNMKMFLKKVGIFLIWGLAALCLMGAQTNPVPASTKLTVLRLVSPWTKTDLSSYPSIKFIERVNEKGKGVVRVDWLGGPEIVPPFEHFSTLRKGLFDMGPQASGYMLGQVRGMSVAEIVKVPPAELRKRSLLDYYDQICRKDAGIVCLGINIYQPGGHLLSTNNPKMAETLDWTGFKVRIFPMMRPLVVAMKGSPVLVPVTEMYSAVEKGLVDAVIAPFFNYRDFSLHEAVKYYLQPGIPYVFVEEMVIREAVWESLSKDVRKILMDAMLEIEQEMTEFWKKKYEEDLKYLRAKGMKPVTQPPKLAEEFNRIAARSIWKELILKEAGERAPEILEKTRGLLIGPVD